MLWWKSLKYDILVLAICYTLRWVTRVKAAATAVHDIEILVGVLSLAHWRAVRLGMLRANRFARTPFELLAQCYPRLLSMSCSASSVVPSNLRTTKKAEPPVENNSILNRSWLAASHAVRAVA